MDLGKLLRQAGVSDVKPKPTFPVKVKVEPQVNKPDEPKQEIVRPVNKPAELPIVELCGCGHPKDAHSDDGGDCEILECDCTSYFPKSQEYDINEIPPDASLATILEVNEAREAAKQDIESDEVHQAARQNLQDEVNKQQEVDQAALKILEELRKENRELKGLPDLPAPSTEAMPDGYCQHLCESCNCWWTHGQHKDCQYPDITKQGLCQNCNKQETYQVDYAKDYEPKSNGSGLKMTPTAQIRVRNDENMICANMNIEQLTRHIEFYAMKIEELHNRSLQARHLRGELEEEELANIPESEREAFIQALRRGESKEKKPRAARKAKDPSLLSGKAKEAALTSQLKAQGKPPEVAKVIAAMMVKTGKTQEQVEAWLND